MARIDEAEVLTWALKGDSAAISFCQSVFRVSQIWDDLVDGDKPVTPDEVNEAFCRCLIDIPENPFYQRHITDLTPLIRQYVTDWMDANYLEREGRHEQNIAFVLRDSVGALVSQCAYLIGGYNWMRQVSVKVRKHIFEDTIEEYLSELEREKP